jgi:hypothetical protein
VFGVDVTDPETPIVRGSLTLQSSSSLLSPVSLIYSGYWLVHDYSRNQIYVINIEDPDQPSVLSQWSVPNMVNGGPGIMMIEGDLLYLPCGENSTLRIYDLFDVTSVSEIGLVSTGEEAYGPAVKIGNYLYMTTSVYRGSSYMKVVDVSDLENPVILKTLAFTGYLKSQKGQLFSFAVSTPTITAYSLEDPTTPIVEESTDIPIPAPSTALGLYPLSFPSAAWVGDYLVGITYGSEAAYHAIRAFYFIVN